MDKLRALQEQASPGPWVTEEYGIYSEAGRRVSDTLTFSSSRDKHAGPAEWKPENLANAKLAALATHLLPLAEAVENAPCEVTGSYGLKNLCPGRQETITPGEWITCTRCKALKALQEALE